jgi:hypothetical protein
MQPQTAWNQPSTMLCSPSHRLLLPSPPSLTHPTGQCSLRQPGASHPQCFALHLTASCCLLHLHPPTHLTGQCSLRQPGAAHPHNTLLTLLPLAAAYTCTHPHILQDNAASDSLEPAIRLIHLNRVMRQAVRLIRGVQLGIEQEQLRFSVFSAIPWFKVREQRQGRESESGSLCSVCKHLGRVRQAGVLDVVERVLQSGRGARRWAAIRKVLCSCASFVERMRP